MTAKRPIALLTLLALLLSGCASGNPQNPDVKKPEGIIIIGYSMSTIQEERWTKDRDIFVARAGELGAKVIVTNADNDPQRQLSQVEYLLQQNIDVLVITPQSAVQAAQAVELAKRAGVPVMSYDRLVLNAGTDLYVSFDNKDVGWQMAKEATARAPKGNYLLVNGSPEDHNSKLFRQGYVDYLAPYVARGDIKVLEEYDAKDWRREEAYNFVSAELAKGDNIAAIICANDALAGGAVQALAETRLAGKVVVTGHDADLAACQRIVEGTQTVTVYKPIKAIAQKAAEAALQMAKREKPATTETINDGKYDVPYIKLKVIPVTKENMDEVIVQDGFHLKEDIYRDVDIYKATPTPEASPSGSPQA